MTARQQAKKKKILSVGEIIWDIYPSEHHIGGAPLNFAAHCAGCGCDSAILSAVGADELGSEALERVRAFGVKTDLIKTVADKFTGQCLVTLDERSVPTYNVLTDTAYDNIPLSDRDIEAIRAQRFDVFYFGTLIQRSPVSRAAVRKVLDFCDFPEIFCDVNMRRDCYDEESLSLCLDRATILKISDEEEPILRGFGFYKCASDEPGDIARAIAKRYKNLKIIILTRGDKGSYAYDVRTNDDVYREIFPVPVVSTVGAGDSFSAAWLSAYLNAAPLSDCMTKAAKLSAFVVAHEEAVPPRK